jgi:hypothetical protein
MNRKTKQRLQAITRELTEALIHDDEGLALLRELSELIVEVRHEKPQTVTQTVERRVEVIKPDPKTVEENQKLRSALHQERAMVGAFLEAIGSETATIFGHENPTCCFIHTKAPRCIFHLGTKGYIQDVIDRCTQGKISKDKAAFDIWHRAMNSVLWLDPPRQADELAIGIGLKGFAIQLVSGTTIAADVLKYDLTKSATVFFPTNP